MDRANFFEYLYTSGAISRQNSHEGITWYTFISVDGKYSAQILADMELEVSRREANINCDKLKIRRFPAGVFTF